MQSRRFTSSSASESSLQCFHGRLDNRRRRSLLRYLIGTTYIRRSAEGPLDYLKTVVFDCDRRGNDT